MTKEPVSPYKMNLPTALKGRIEEAAHQNRRSVSAEIISTLEREYPEPTYSAEEFMTLLQSMAAPMSIEEQIERAEVLNGTMEHFGVKLEAHLVGGDIVLSPTSDD